MPERQAPRWSQEDEVRRALPLIAIASAVLAATTDPGPPGDLVLAAIPVAAFALYALRPSVPLPLIALLVVVPVVAAQRSAHLEPLLFDVSLLAFAAGRFSPSLAVAAGVGVLAVAAPVAAAVIQDPADISVGIWILGIAFPWVAGLAAARQEQLAAELDSTRAALAEQALLAERRRIARDVHDLVGHGLAAVMLQVTGARHVLRRDPELAEEALRSAEDVGRRSMQELRRTVAVLRGPEDDGPAPPLPSAREIPALVDHTRAGGVAVELRMRGDLSLIAPGVGIAAYRIAQEALANAARHAPNARTVLALALADDTVSLVAETTGSVASSAPDPDRARYGLIGMRERATALGGQFAAGPTPDGWRVSCTLPLQPQRGAS